MAKEAIPIIVLSMAADTVPEYVISSPRLAPLLIPDATKTGFSGRIFCIPSATQSVGVPFTL